MSKRPKNCCKKLKIKEISQICSILKKNYCKLCFLVKYILGVSFIDLHEEIRDLKTKNAKPQYANKIKVQISESSQN